MHPCGLRLVPGPAGPEIAAALPSGFAAALVRELRVTAPAVIDAGTAAFAASREVAVAADRVLVVVTPDAYAAAGGRELVTGLTRWGAGTDAIAVVVNRWSRRSELSLRGIARSVGAPVVAAVGADPAGMDAFANGHARLERWPGRSHAEALRDLAAELTG
jgi:Flp pilus assembly CpaE family ATPase